MRFMEKRSGILKGAAHLFAALRYSLHGLWHCAASSIAFRQECLVFLVLCAAAVFLPLKAVPPFLCLFFWLAVMALELLNSAIEETVDMITKEFCEGAKRAKDMASAAVFVMVLFNIGVWLYVFYKDFYLG